MTDWFRSWHGAPSDPKWRTIARKAECRPGDVAAVVWYLLDRASAASDRGSIAGHDVEIIADTFGYDQNAVERIVTTLRAKGVIGDDDRLIGWEKYQVIKEDSSTARTRAYRERKERSVTPGDDAVTISDDGKREDRKRDDPRAEQSRTEQSRKNPSLRSGVPQPKTKTVIREEETILSATDLSVVEPPSPDEVDLGVRAYNAVAGVHGWPVVRHVSDTRAKQMRARLGECGGVDGWTDAMARAGRSPFLTGASGRTSDHEDWRPGLDFFLQRKSLTKLMEGQYDGQENGHSPRRTDDSIASSMARALASRARQRGESTDLDDGILDDAGAAPGDQPAGRTIEGEVVSRTF